MIVDFVPPSMIQVLLSALVDDGKKYPPKRILEPGVPRSKFYGGKPSNDVICGLGFRVEEAEVGRTTPEEIAKEQACLAEPVPDVNQLVKDLFARTWIDWMTRLDDDATGLVDARYPGVYMLAYPEAHVETRRFI